MECRADHYRPTVGILREDVCVRMCVCLCGSRVWKIIIRSRQGCEREGEGWIWVQSLVTQWRSPLPSVWVCVFVCGVFEEEEEKEIIQYSVPVGKHPAVCVCVCFAFCLSVGGNTGEGKWNSDGDAENLSALQPTFCLWSLAVLHSSMLWSFPHALGISRFIPGANFQFKLVPGILL